jgi:hypothetical protein
MTKPFGEWSEIIKCPVCLTECEIIYDQWERVLAQSHCKCHKKEKNIDKEIHQVGVDLGYIKQQG